MENHGNGGSIVYDNRKRPTQAQIDYANDLIQKLGHDPDWYDLEKMTRSQIARLIDELRDEWEG